MEIISALFVENLDFRQAPGPSTRIDLQGVYFSFAAPSPELPVSVSPHLVVLVRCPLGGDGNSVLETSFRNPAGEEVARSVQPFAVEPGRFGYRLVKGELTFDDYGTIEAWCRLGQGPWVTVPLTLLPPAGE